MGRGARAPEKRLGKPNAHGLLPLSCPAKARTPFSWPDRTWPKPAPSALRWSRGFIRRPIHLACPRPLDSNLLRGHLEDICDRAHLYSHERALDRGRGRGETDGLLKAPAAQAAVDESCRMGGAGSAAVHDLDRRRPGADGFPTPGHRAALSGLGDNGGGVLDRPACRISSPVLRSGSRLTTTRTDGMSLPKQVPLARALARVCSALGLGS